MKKLYVILLTGLMLFSISNNATAQNRPAWMDKVYVGGGLGGFSISSDAVFVSANGLVGYKFTDKLEAGMGLNYQYAKNKIIDVSYNDWGLNWFAMYHVYSPAFLMARYEILFLDEVGNYDTFLIGGGISQPAGSRAAINFYALYNVTYNTNLPPGSPENGRYDSPWVIGMNVGVGF